MSTLSQALSLVELSKKPIVQSTELLATLRYHAFSTSAVSPRTVKNILGNNPHILPQFLVDALPACIIGIDRIKRNFSFGRDPLNWAKITDLLVRRVVNSNDSKAIINARTILEQDLLNQTITEAALVAVDFYPAKGNESRRALETAHILKLTTSLLYPDTSRLGALSSLRMGNKS